MEILVAVGLLLVLSVIFMSGAVYQRFFRKSENPGIPDSADEHLPVNIVATGGTKISDVRMDAGVVVASRVTVRNSKANLCGARIIDSDEEGTQLFLEAGCHFRGVVNGKKIDYRAPDGGGQQMVQIAPPRVTRTYR